MHLALICRMLLTLAPADPSQPFEFRDESTCDHRSVLHFRSVVLNTTSPRPVQTDGESSGNVRYGLVRVGPDPEAALLVMCSPQDDGTWRIWLDADGDGRLAPNEAQVLGHSPVEIPVRLRTGSDTAPPVLDRTLILRRSAAGDTILYAVRGFIAGTLSIDGVPHRAALVDGNADGLFDGPGVDRIWVDLDDDGHFDALAEQFVLGTAITIGGDAFTISTDAEGRSVSAHRRSQQRGTLRLSLGVKGQPSISKAGIRVVSDLGELFGIDHLDEAIPLPVAHYRIASLSLEVAEDRGPKWAYEFDGRNRYPITIEPDGETTIELLAGLGARLNIMQRGAATDSGRTWIVTPALVADSGLYLARCTVQRADDGRPMDLDAPIRLIGPGGKTLDQTRSGFA